MFYINISIYIVKKILEWFRDSEVLWLGNPYSSLWDRQSIDCFMQKAAEKYSQLLLYDAFVLNNWDGKRLMNNPFITTLISILVELMLLIWKLLGQWSLVFKWLLASKPQTVPGPHLLHRPLPCALITTNPTQMSFQPWLTQCGSDLFLSPLLYHTIPTQMQRDTNCACIYIWQRPRLSKLVSICRFFPSETIDHQTDSWNVKCQF